MATNGRFWTEGIGRGYCRVRRAMPLFVRYLPSRHINNGVYVTVGLMPSKETFDNKAGFPSSLKWGLSC